MARDAGRSKGHWQQQKEWLRRPPGDGSGNVVADDAIRALLPLGDAQVEAERAVKAVTGTSAGKEVSRLVRAE